MSTHQTRRSRQPDRVDAPGLRPGGPAPMRPAGAQLDPATRSRLEPGFGHSLSDIRVHSDADADRLAQGFSADAFTVGQDIFFSQGRYDPGSAEGGHLLAHEVAHAVQQRGADTRGADFGTLPVPGRHARSETEAHAAAHAVTHGRPARVGTGAVPAVSRWESGEHKHAVDDAKLPEGMGGKIKLANGMEVTPGEITAMMGDLYGRFDTETDKDGKKVNHFNPAKSFEQMNKGDPKEMAALIQHIDYEAAHPKELTDASDWEKITRNRSGGDDSFLELAKKNNSHFSAPDSKGTDNNMGAYTAFHQMALDAAKSGDMEKARALEASGDHFLTDRFSAGHSLEKNGVMAASGHDANGVLANMAVKTAHDDFNKNGTMLHDADNKDKEWKAFGDGKWDDQGNADNRDHTQKAVSDSWAELAQSDPNRAHSPAEQAAKYNVPGEVPHFDPKNQERAEAVARHTSLPGMLWDYGGEAPGAIAGSLWRVEGHVENGLSDAWDWTKGAATWAGHETVQGAKAVRGAVEDAAKWTGHKAVQGVDAVGDAAAWTGHKIASGVGAGVGAVEDAGSWAGGKLKSAWDWL